jgi:hypothetical protein
MTARSVPAKRAHTMTRRTFLTSVAMATGSLVIASRMPPSRAFAATSPGPDFQLKARESNPKYAGTLRHGIRNDPGHFDLHQSATVVNCPRGGLIEDGIVESRKHLLSFQQTSVSQRCLCRRSL